MCNLITFSKFELFLLFRIHFEQHYNKIENVLKNHDYLVP